MTRQRDTNRRNFLRNAGLLLAMPLAVKVVGCADEPGQYPPGGGGTPPGGGGGGNEDAESFSVMNSDSSGHSHSFEIECAQVNAGGWTYTADGAHSHDVALTEDELALIFAGGTVTVQTTDGHPHTWVIAMPSGMCASDSGGGGGGTGGGGGGGGGW